MEKLNKIHSRVLMTGRLQLENPFVNLFEQICQVVLDAYWIYKIRSWDEEVGYSNPTCFLHYPQRKCSISSLIFQNPGQQRRPFGNCFWWLTCKSAVICLNPTQQKSVDTGTFPKAMGHSCASHKIMENAILALKGVFDGWIPTLSLGASFLYWQKMHWNRNTETQCSHWPANLTLT